MTVICGTLYVQRTIPRLRRGLRRPARTAHRNVFAADPRQSRRLGLGILSFSPEAGPARHGIPGLFGLGFDTATEAALLGIAATQAVHRTSIWSIIVFPALFTAGMSLIDTTDGVLTLGAYNWAFIKSDPQALLQIWSSPRYPWWSRY